MSAIDKMIELTEKAEQATARLPHSQALGCTELQAAWCPVHGDCTCDSSGQTIEWNPLCPLHPEDIWSPFFEQAPLLEDWQEWQKQALGIRCHWPDCHNVAVFQSQTILPGATEVVYVCDFHSQALIDFHGQENVKRKPLS